MGFSYHFASKSHKNKLNKQQTLIVPCAKPAAIVFPSREYRMLIAWLGPSLQKERKMLSNKPANFVLNNLRKHGHRSQILRSSFCSANKLKD